MNNDLAEKVKEYQQANGAILAGTGYVKFDFGKPDENEAAMEVPEEIILDGVKDKNVDMEQAEVEDAFPKGEDFVQVFHG